jgi:hypothetical protein
MTCPLTTVPEFSVLCGASLPPAPWYTSIRLRQRQLRLDAACTMPNLTN